MRLEVRSYKSADILISTWIARLRLTRRASIVRIVRRLVPGIEHNLLIGMVRMQCSDHPPDRIIEEHGTYTDANTKLVAVRGAEEWLELANRLAFVVEDRPARGDPASIDEGARAERWRRAARVPPELPLNLAAETIGVSESELNFRPCGGSGALTCVSRDRTSRYKSAATVSGRPGRPLAYVESDLRRRRHAWWRL